MNKNRFKIFLSLLGVFSLLPGLVFADDLESQCTVISANGNCPNMSVDQCKGLLQQCSDYYDQQSIKISKDITTTSAQKDSLAKQVSLLKNRIQNLEYQISQGNVKVQGLNIQIADTQSSIDKTGLQINSSKTQIASILRAIEKEDKKPLIEILLEGNLSHFFSNLVALENLNEKVSMLLESTQDLQEYLNEQKTKMDSEIDDLQRTISLQRAQKIENDKNKKLQEQNLQITEAQYQSQIQDKQALEKKASAVKALLFQMAGVSQVPTFGEALEVAKVAGSSVGVRPAFLLAIISQESALGRNTGQCVLTDPSTGSGKRISTGASVIHIMKPTRDVKPFLEITTKLGRDPYDTPVSCWITDYRGGVPFGWGGAMGPAQFIPSTWNLFINRLTKVLGKYPDPWGIKDSFTASGMYLADLGATAQTMSAEKKAASRYYGGSSSYANSVYNRATCIQSFVDTNSMSTYCQNLIF